MKKSIYRVIALILAVVLITADSSVTVFATQITDAEENVVFTEVQPDEDELQLQEEEATPSEDAFENDKEPAEADEEELEIPDGFVFVPGIRPVQDEIEYESVNENRGEDELLGISDERYISPQAVNKPSRIRTELAGHLPHQTQWRCQPQRME